jgi:hypothetical protein
MANLVSVDEFRQTSGVTTDLMDDDTISTIIRLSEKQTLSDLKLNKTPTKVIDIVNGQGKDQLQLKRPFVWKLLEVVNYNDSINIDSLTINPSESIIYMSSLLTNSFNFRKGFVHWNNAVKVKYLSAFMEKSEIITESTLDIEVGTNVDIAVDDSDFFEEDDWVLIEGTDGKREAAQITAVSSNLITVDQLTQNHESGSVITTLKTHELLKQYILYDSSTNAANYIVGNTSALPTSYSLPEYSATVGVAFTHWEKSARSFKEKAEKYKARILAKISPVA